MEHLRKTISINIGIIENSVVNLSIPFGSEGKSVSIYLFSNSTGVPLFIAQLIIIDYYCRSFDYVLCDHLKNALWKYIFEFVLLLLLPNTVSGFNN